MAALPLAHACAITTKLAAGLLPVTLAEPPAAADEATEQMLRSSSQRRLRVTAAAGGVIEIDLPLGRVRLTGAVDVAALRVVIEALSSR